jgi:catechol 2,3-dioxygenase-like lactoylglutathione lyase family enzyme
MEKIEGLSFSHCGIFVTDLDRMVNFYTKYLGFVVSDRGVVGQSEFAFITRNPDEHHQIVMSTGRKKGEQNTIQQISFRVDNLSMMRSIYAKVCEAGDLVSLEGHALGPMSHTVALSVYFGDPDNNRVELFVDTPWYITQPTRELLDLSLSDHEIMASVEAFARKQPGFRPRSEWSEEIRKKIQAATPI